MAVPAIFALSLGLTYPLLAIILEAQGESSTLIGLNTAMTPLGIIVAAPFVPALARRFGAWQLAVGCALATALLMAAINAYRDVWVWFPLRFALGASIDSLFILSETWLLQLAGRHNRGRLVGLYGTLLASGFVVGPFVLAVTGSEGWLAFGIGIAVMVVTAATLFAIRRRVPAQVGGTEGSIRAFAALAPGLLLAVGVVVAFDQVALSLLPVYLLGLGEPEARAALALGVLVSGNVLLQLPIGWASDRFSRPGVMGVCLACALGCCVALPFSAGTLMVWPVLFLLGAGGFGVYTVVLADLGDRFGGAMLLAGNAAFALMWGVGGIVGPPLTGVLMDQLGSWGLPATLGASFLLLMGTLRRVR